NLGQALSAATSSTFSAPTCFALSPVLETLLGRGWGCGRLASGVIQCWGLVIGTGSTILAPPGMAAPALTATKLGGGMGHACARIADGSVKCWGANAEGEIGDGTNQDETVVTSVLDAQGNPLGNVLSDGLSRSGVAMHSCAISGN